MSNAQFHPLPKEVSYEVLSEFLYRSHAVCSPAELHGFLCGMLCEPDTLTVSEWLDEALEFMDILDKPAEELESVLSALLELNATRLKVGNYQLQLLLPDDALPLAERSRALAEWCDSFMYSFGQIETQVDNEDSEQNELLNDLANISQLDDVEESEANEAAFAELCEYVRTAVFTLFSLHHPDASSEQESNSTLH